MAGRNLSRRVSKINSRIRPVARSRERKKQLNVRGSIAIIPQMDQIVIENSIRDTIDAVCSTPEDAICKFRNATYSRR